MLHKKIDFGEFMYKRLPEVYRTADSEAGIDYTLKRYLSALDEGGIQTLFAEMFSLYDLFDVYKCPRSVLPLLGKLLGYNYIEEVDERTQRKIISNLAELYKRRGTKSVVKFISREFTMGDTRMVELQYRIFKTYSKDADLPTSEKEEGNIPKTYNLNSHGIDTTTYCIYSKTGKYNGNGIFILVDGETQIDLLNRLLADFLPVHCKMYVEVRKPDDPIMGEQLSNNKPKIEVKPSSNLYVRYTTGKEENKEGTVLARIEDSNNPNIAIEFVEGANSNETTTNQK